MDAEIKYEKCYLSFVDILGFTDYVTADKSDGSYQNSANQIFNLLNIHKRTFNWESELLNGTEITIPKTFVISDSIFRILKENQINFQILDLLSELHTLCVLQYDMIKYDVLVRGAITYGDLYYDDDKVFGPCLIEALGLEKNRAKYPRIIVTNPVKNNLEFSENVLKIDSDGSYYLDYLRVAFKILDDEEVLSHHMSVIEKKIAQARKAKNYSYIDKLIWLADYHNDFIGEISNKNKTFEEFYCKLDNI